MADPEKPLRMAALLGITGPSGPVAVVTSDTDLVRQIQGFLPDTGIVGVSGVAPAGGGEVGMGWALASGGLPFGSRSLGGVVLASGDATEQVGEALRVLARGARVVIDPAPPGIAEALLLEGGDLLLEQDGVAVAFDPRAG